LHQVEIVDQDLDRIVDNLDQLCRPRRLTYTMEHLKLLLSLLIIYEF
jgi:hypothetical protein